MIVGRHSSVVPGSKLNSISHKSAHQAHHSDKGIGGHIGGDDPA